MIYNTIRGDTGSFGKLVERYQHQIFNLAARMVNDSEDARDITQETFIKAFHSLPSFRYECRFKTWLHRIASNTCLDHLRRRNRANAGRVESAPEHGPELLENIPATADGPEEKLIRSERKAAVREALQSLPDAYRLPLLMQHYQGMSYREISTALNIPEKTVATRLYRAKTMLREKLLGGESGEVLKGKTKVGRSSGRGVHAL